MQPVFNGLISPGFVGEGLLQSGQLLFGCDVDDLCHVGLSRKRRRRQLKLKVTCMGSLPSCLTYLTGP
jgi:hypothetical protein